MGELTNQDKVFLDKLSDSDRTLLELFLTSVEENTPKVLESLDQIEDNLGQSILGLKNLKQHPES